MFLPITRLSLIAIASVFSVLHLPIFSQEYADFTVIENNVELTPPLSRFDIKHSAGRGIGYHKGYSSLTGFCVIPNYLEMSYLPFIDMRGHVFNDGRIAANAGAGLRFIGSRIWGINAYYDYRDTEELNYNQIGVGFESLGNCWDFRLNTYWPVGCSKSSFTLPKFYHFHKQEMILARERHFALFGADSEFGFHGRKMQYFDFYAAIGPYYFTRQEKNAFGGKARVIFTICNMVKLEVSSSYDNVFRSTVQGKLGLYFPFGGREEIAPGCDPCCYGTKLCLEEAFQPVERSEIIAVTDRHYKKKAINPDTGKPYRFIFVDNSNTDTDSNSGTVKSPYDSLMMAEVQSNPYDVIYVLPGDSTDVGLNTGIRLKQGQQLLGGGIVELINTQEGIIAIPAQGIGLPFVTNTLSFDGSAVTLDKGNNIVSGLNLSDELGNSGTKALLISKGDNYLIQNNQLTSYGDGSALLINRGSDVTISNNVFFGADQDNSRGINITSSSGALSGQFNISENMFSGIDQNSGFDRAISVNTTNVDGTLEFTIEGNHFNSMTNMATSGGGDSPAAIYFLNTATNGNNIIANIIGNDIVVPTTMQDALAGVYIQEDAAATTPFTAILNGNISTTVAPTWGYQFVNNTGDASLLDVIFGSDNVGTVTGP